jgi:hypothetical protein
MVVLDSNLEGVTTVELERHSVLVVDPDAVTSLLVALQPFEPVRWRDGQKRQVGGGVDPFQLALNRRP